MTKRKTNLKEVLEVSPFLWEYQHDKKDVKKYTIQLINEGLEASEVVRQVRLWLANNRKPVEPSTSSKKIDYIGYHSVRTNAAATISLKNTLKLPPYRRVGKQERPIHLTMKTSENKNDSKNSQLRNWLASLDETERASFINWCIKQGKIPNKILWVEYKRTVSTPRASHSTPPSFKQRSFIDDGWAKKRVRKSQESFRQDVLINWNGRCAITGSIFAIEACHIVSHSSGGAPSVENGIALAADLHFLLDNGHLKIIDNCAIFSDEARKDPRYSEYHNIKLRDPIVPIKIT